MTTDTTNWRPTATTDKLIKRANLLENIRQFFKERCVLEVETPLLAHFSVTDPHLDSFKTELNNAGSRSQNGTSLSLITSPEYHMKRLIIAGSGPIFQIGKCFRNREEISRYHNPEFTMLEWYRTHFDMMKMINEVDDLFQTVLECEPADKVTYQSIFIKYVQIDPLTCEIDDLRNKIDELEIVFDSKNASKDDLLQLLFGYLIEPNLGKERPVAVYCFPSSQAALAEICCEDSRVANRFEFYYKGIELANGFKELTDPDEQQARFEHDNVIRQKLGLSVEPIDSFFLEALKNNMPDCAGVAIGIDRLTMIALGLNEIKDVMSFTMENA